MAYSAYLPTSGQDDFFIEILSQLQYDIEQNISENCVVIVGIDSNCSSRSTKRRIEAMNKFLNKISLCTILTTNDATFHHNNGTSQTQIDHIYKCIPNNSQIEVSLLHHLCKIEESSNLSSHDALIGKIKFPKESELNSQVDYSLSYSQFERKTPKWDLNNLQNYQEQTFKILNDAFETFDEPEHIPILTEIVSRTLVQSAEINFTKQSNNTKSENAKKKISVNNFSSDIKDAYNEHKRICNDWRKAGRPNDSLNPHKQAKINSQRNLQNIRRQENSNKAQQLNEELMAAHKNIMTLMFKKLKKQRGDLKPEAALPFIETLNGTYEGQNVLEGFRINTEILCSDIEDDKSESKCQFYKMCVQDNEIIFQITENEEKIPMMTLSNLKDIIFKRLKLNKACDIFMLTVEHLRYSGDPTMILILSLINKIIDNINYLSSSQLNTAIASVVYKGKDKPIYHHKSYRLVRVTPLIGRLLDEFVRPKFISSTRPTHNPNQYGFTEGLSYQLAALQRHEVEAFCIDNKKTLFTVTLDGVSAFDVINRQIQKRELYVSNSVRKYKDKNKNAW